MSTERTQTLNRRFLRFSVRGLLLFTMTFCVLLGWHVERARKQRNAVLWVKRLGGAVFYEHELDGGGSLKPTAKPPATEWLIESLGVDFFDNVAAVWFLGNESLGYQMGYPVAKLDENTDLTTLADFSKLKWLHLHRTELGDLSPLTDLKKLEKLQLSGSTVRDLSPLASLTRLKSLQLDGTDVRDVSWLSSLQALEELHLGDTQVSDASALSSLENLSLLDLRRTPLSEVAPLKGLKNLRELRLNRTQVRDLTPLGRLENLRRLTVEDSLIELDSLRELQAKLPKCGIDVQAVLDLDL